MTIRDKTGVAITYSRRFEPDAEFAVEHYTTCPLCGQPAALVWRSGQEWNWVRRVIWVHYDTGYEHHISPLEFMQAVTGVIRKDDTIAAAVRDQLTSNSWLDILPDKAKAPELLPEG